MSDILIVDDERDIRELVADILKDEGFGGDSFAPMPAPRGIRNGSVRDRRRTWAM